MRGPRVISHPIGHILPQSSSHPYSTQPPIPQPTVRGCGSREVSGLTSYGSPPLNGHYLLLLTTSYRSPDAGGRGEETEVGGGASACVCVWR